MSNNYEGLTVGQKNTQSRSLDEIYRRWDAASNMKQEEGTSRRVEVTSNKASLLPTVAAEVLIVTAVLVAAGLITTVVAVGWALL